MAMVELGKTNTIMYNDKRLNMKRFKKFFSDGAFTMVTVFAIVTLSLGLIMLKETDYIPLNMGTNMTNHCDDPQYSMRLQLPPNRLFSYFMIDIVFLIFFVTTIGNFISFNPDKRNASLKILQEIAGIAVHFLVFSNIIEIIKVMSGVPSPYYFENEDLYNLHCLNPPIVNKSEEEIMALEKFMRTSFPSYRAAFLSYCSAVLILFIDHYDISTGLHTAQQVVVLLLGGVFVHLLTKDVEYGAYHMADVTVGIIIGAFCGAITIRNLFGTMFHQHTDCCEEEMDQRIFEIENQFDLTTSKSGFNISKESKKVVITSQPTKNPDFNYFRINSEDMILSA